MAPRMVQLRTSFSRQEQSHRYERLTPTSGNFLDEQKLTMLQTSVHTLQEFCQVKATAALLKVQTKKDLDYEAYSSLLFSTASDYDSKHGVSKGKRQVYAHDLEHDDAKICMMHHTKSGHSMSPRRSSEYPDPGWVYDPPLHQRWTRPSAHLSIY
jgi:hypothetical protein